MQTAKTEIKGGSVFMWYILTEIINNLLTTVVYKICIMFNISEL